MGGSYIPCLLHLALGLQVRSPLSRNEGQTPALPRLLKGQEPGDAIGSVS